MKKILFKLLTIIFAITLCLAVFTACDNNIGDDTPAHTHYYTTIKSNELNHWHECTCGEKQGIEAHKGGTATCQIKAKCAVCSKEYGNLETHKYLTYNYNNNATCKANGTETAYCEYGCGESVVRERLGTITSTHFFGDDGWCTICKKVFNNHPTEGVVYFVPRGANYAIVLGYEGVSKRVVIADTYNNLPVKEIGKDAFYESNITHVIIPEGVENIGDSAFFNCDNLISVTMPNSIISIGSSAFANCSNLEIVNLPKQLKNIGHIAFKYTKTYYNNENWIDNVFYIDNWVVDSKTSILGSCSIKDGTVGICGYAFYNCKKLTNIYISNTVKFICDSAFNYCTSLKSVIIPENVACIGNNAFYNCTNLVELIATGDIESIGGYSFYGCPIETAVVPINVFRFIEKENLINVTITKADEIEFGAFEQCINMVNLTLPFVTGYLGSLFGISSVFENDGIPKSLKTVTITGDADISSGAFKGCKGLISVTICDSVTSIGDYAFSNCNSLTNITIPNSVTSIGDYVFSNCNSLANITIPNSVTSIGRYAFSNCSSLTKIEIPNSVTSRGCGAFSGCSSLREITLPFIGAKAGVTSSNINQYPLGYIFGSEKFEGGTAVKQYYHGNDLSSWDTSTYYIPTTLTHVTVNGGEILYGAFYDCEFLTSVVLGNAVTNIERQAFYRCYDLTSVIIGENVVNVAEHAFYLCYRLTNVTMYNKVVSIGKSAFSNYLYHISINYNGTMEEWNSINKENGWYSESISIICFDGNIEYK